MERDKVQRSSDPIPLLIKPLTNGVISGSLKATEKEITAGGPGCFGWLGRVLGVYHNELHKAVLKDFLKRLGK